MNEEPQVFNRVIFSHNDTCTCIECRNSRELAGMKYIAFAEHRGYMEQPVEFLSLEEAQEYIKENKSFTEGYIVFGKLIS